jgi:tetratricopeptide (TPR) repeat protein
MMSDDEMPNLVSDSSDSSSESGQDEPAKKQAKQPAKKAAPKATPKEVAPKKAAPTRERSGSISALLSTSDRDSDTHSSDNGQPAAKEARVRDQRLQNQQDKKLQDLKGQGNAAFKKGNFDKSIDMYTKAIKIKPTHILFSNRSIAWLKKEPATANAKKQALEDAKRCVELNGNWAKGHMRSQKNTEWVTFRTSHVVHCIAHLKEECTAVCHTKCESRSLFALSASPILQQVESDSSNGNRE